MSGGPPFPPRLATTTSAAPAAPTRPATTVAAAPPRPPHPATATPVTTVAAAPPRPLHPTTATPAVPPRPPHPRPPLPPHHRDHRSRHDRRFPRLRDHRSPNDHRSHRAQRPTRSATAAPRDRRAPQHPRRDQRAATPAPRDQRAPQPLFPPLPLFRRPASPGPGDRCAAGRRRQRQQRWSAHTIAQRGLPIRPGTDRRTQSSDRVRPTGSWRWQQSTQTLCVLSSSLAEDWPWAMQPTVGARRLWSRPVQPIPESGPGPSIGRYRPNHRHSRRDLSVVSVRDPLAEWHRSRRRKVS
jgi:hypothetical protein